MLTLGANGSPIAEHDAAACILDEEGRLLAFAEEERFTGNRHSLHESPRQAVRYCLSAANAVPEEVGTVAIGWDVPAMYPSFHREWYPSDSLRITRALFGGDVARRLRAEVVYVPHHVAHALSAFYFSPFPRAAVAVIDGQGEEASTSIFSTDKRGLNLVCSWPIETSLGYLYEAATQWLGYNRLDCGKTMGLAAYGERRRVREWRLLAVAEDDIRSPVTTASDGYGADPVHQWMSILSERVGRAGPTSHKDQLCFDPLATSVGAAVQVAVEEVIAWLAQVARNSTGINSLCLAGGVALNCSANALIPEPVFVPPAPHDAGVALGAAWYATPPRAHPQATSPYLGPSPGPIPSSLDVRGLRVRPLEIGEVTERLLRGEKGAIAQGRVEVGPRALCHRSILSLAETGRDRAILNAMKGREPWRPLGPVARRRATGNLWADSEHLPRFMTGALRMSDEGAFGLPAVAHVDGSTRPQHMEEADSPFVFAVLSELSGVGRNPVLVNTSLNRPGRPIANSAIDAVSAFRALGLDFLALNEELITIASASRNG